MIGALAGVTKEEPMRFGLVGTGSWAARAHGPGLSAAQGVELVGVWGRDVDKAGRLAESLGVRAYADYDALLDDVEGVAFAVPPDVQASRALAAARAGRHLLLDKPLALDAAAAGELADVVAEQGLASLVFFTDRFADETRQWFDDLSQQGGWLGGWSRSIVSLDAPTNPYGGSRWRRERGALWDAAPHTLSTLSAALGPIVSISATAGRADLVHLVLSHHNGATSTATLTLLAPEAAQSGEVAVWGERGISAMPRRSRDPREPYARAAAELVACADSGSAHPVDVRFGAHVVSLLEDAQRQISP